jgi:hypothetical protein
MSGLASRVAKLEAVVSGAPCPVCRGAWPMRVEDPAKPHRHAGVEPCSGCGGLIRINVIRDRRTLAQGVTA